MMNEMEKRRAFYSDSHYWFELQLMMFVVFNLNHENMRWFWLAAFLASKILGRRFGASSDVLPARVDFPNS